MVRTTPKNVANFPFRMMKANTIFLFVVILGVFAASVAAGVPAKESEGMSR